MLIVIIRTVILYLAVLVVLRLMGKRQIGELQPFDLAVTIMVSELAAMPMQNTDVPLINSLLPISLILILQIYISVINTKSFKAREIVCGSPDILIENGQLNEEELRKNRISIHELLEELRVKGYHNLAEIEFAFIETNGQVSVIPKSQNRPVTPEDLEIETDYEGVAYSLIVDGKVYQPNLDEVGLSKDWLKNELSNFGINDLSDVLFANIDSSGNIFYQLYDS
ncbi:DUF421 domain-containing protein [Acetohalobium arabaticum]|uniref:YetF C-terminal domain-containing protein n=1 Tax=Acetohalobium arabaticum (strain ATCC 49924 / DSM 5501 / Z-7288) TaxID=574087 RepID=D9QRA3_ACEAZ|nr:DUF421 domain-containing protein [Acetohalobium arabaticum]ADL13044.1 protein of unknown function DUF421 [Acetohalobium arabaticum DSM 5501]